MCSESFTYCFKWSLQGQRKASGDRSLWIWTSNFFKGNHSLWSSSSLIYTRLNHSNLDIILLAINDTYLCIGISKISRKSGTTKFFLRSLRRETKLTIYTLSSKEMYTLPMKVELSSISSYRQAPTLVIFLFYLTSPPLTQPCKKSSPLYLICF